VTGASPALLIDGSQLFTARAALTALASGTAGAGAPRAAVAAGPSPGPSAGQAPVVRVLYNPGLKTADIMIPGLAGVVLVFVGTIITS